MAVVEWSLNSKHIFRLLIDEKLFDLVECISRNNHIK